MGMTSFVCVLLMKKRILFLDFYRAKDLLKWVRDVIKEHEFIIVIERSETRTRTFVLLTCEKEG